MLSRWGEHVIRADEWVHDALHRMSLGPVAVDNLAPATGHPTQLAAVVQQVAGSVVRSVGLSDRASLLLSVLPATPKPTFDVPPTAPSTSVRLSRFATLRRCAGELVVESPLAAFRVAVHQPLAAQIVALLAQSIPVADVASHTGTDERVAGTVVGYLMAAGVVRAVQPDGGCVEDADPSLALWSPQDLTFHQRSRSRNGGQAVDLPTGGDPGDQVPVTKPAPDGPRWPLAQPQAGASPTGLAQLDGLLDADHECPHLTGRAVPAADLGRLLYASARIRGPGPARLPHGMTHLTTQRPYVNIACLYELEIYVSIGRCTDLPAGVYHYDPVEHALTLVNDSAAERDELLDMAKVAAGSVVRPPVLLSVTARMERTTVLSGAAYATTLMHVGALQQTVALVAGAIGLQAHPVPVDANGVVQRVLRLPWPAEVGVGECVLDVARH